jgi:hypothetical protein
VPPDPSQSEGRHQPSRARAHDQNVRVRRHTKRFSRASAWKGNGRAPHTGAQPGYRVDKSQRSITQTPPARAAGGVDALRCWSIPDEKSVRPACNSWRFGHGHAQSGACRAVCALPIVKTSANSAAGRSVGSGDGNRTYFEPDQGNAPGDPGGSWARADTEARVGERKRQRIQSW